MLVTRPIVRHASFAARDMMDHWRDTICLTPNRGSVTVFCRPPMIVEPSARLSSRVNTGTSKCCRCCVLAWMNTVLDLSRFCRCEIIRLQRERLVPSPQTQHSLLRSRLLPSYFAPYARRLFARKIASFLASWPVFLDLLACSVASCLLS